ncbi:putative ferric-chelate reductase 1 homolog isoform X3 [Xenia sp. Carnegie-2017]|uniref:putative ferric-chelate reductase 1 homolog isoform X3 n=1 Tax=Xenia sp. Carnegie-2017 TaxID=2897299 RepID=UPI001F04E7CA|nr:putative ferric-chelate reductase 1 homolog isoform X3 [Xenia sp. Carnegie-2017]XP_046851996.1 putative ferric-chelate reductase 1 homolog isoform X3 [Xenia sp. Carnegie-2017]
MKVFEALEILCGVLMIVKHGFATPGGAPRTTCRLMSFGHSKENGDLIPRQKKHTSPYEIRAEVVDSAVRLFIEGIVRGFLIQVRQNSSGPALGKFTLTDGNNSIAQYQNCSHEKYPIHASITNRNYNPKTNLTFLWHPVEKSGQNISVKFYATLAETYELFWVKLESNPINPSDISGYGVTGYGVTVRPSIFLWISTSLLIFLSM